MGNSYFDASAVGSAVPFDNSTNGFLAFNVQAAIEEVNAKIVSSITNTQDVYVSKNGNDSTGNGSLGQPYLTVGAALAAVTDASPTKRYGIQVAPGDYAENIVLKANVFVVGSGPLLTKLTGSTINISDATWNNSNDNRSGFQDISINNVATWNFTVEASDSAGKLYFYNIRSGAAWTVTANNSINQLIIQDSQMFGTTTFNGMTTFASGVTWQAGDIVVNSSTLSNCNFTAVGGGTNGNITAAFTTGSPINMLLMGITVSSTTVLSGSGASCAIGVNDGSLPIPANRSFTGGATLTRLNDNFANGLISSGSNIDTTAAVAPTAGQILVATSPTSASWQYPGVAIVNFGDASDGNVVLTTGTTTLSRDMYYNNLTVTSPAILVTNGFRIFVAGTLSGTGTIEWIGNNGTTATTLTGAAGGAALVGSTVGGSGAGAAGGTAGNNTAGAAGGVAATTNGYGGVGAAGGAGSSNTTVGGSGAGGIIGTYNSFPERIVRIDHIQFINAAMAYKQGGAGGSGGGGGLTPLLGTTNGGGGGGGGGGGVIVIFANVINFTGIISVKGGNGGNGAPGGTNNGGGGGGGASGGGGNIYIICIVRTSVGTLTVTGGTPGTGGAANGTGKAGVVGSTGGTGHTEIFNYATSVWAVT